MKNTKERQALVNLIEACFLELKIDLESIRLAVWAERYSFKFKTSSVSLIAETLAERMVERIRNFEDTHFFPR